MLPGFKVSVSCGAVQKKRGHVYPSCKSFRTRITIVAEVQARQHFEGGWRLGVVRFLSVTPYGAVLEALGRLDYSYVPFEIPGGKSQGSY